MLRKFDAENGKVWKSKLTEEILSETLYLGKEDMIDNYEEVSIDAVNQEQIEESVSEEY